MEIKFMTNAPFETKDALRQRAEEISRLDEAALLKTLSLKDAQQVFHELRVHQIELEMQNEELRCTQHELEASRTRYFELYDLAPVGYLTLSEQGLIQEANLTVATMLGLERNSMLNNPISRWIYREDQDIYYLHRKKVFEVNELQTWEMRLMRADGSPFWARLQAVPANNGEYWITLTDINKTKQVEEALALKQQQLDDINQSLETRISMAVAEILQKDEILIHQGRLAAMGEMINNIAHQWRQPLNNLGLIVQSMQFFHEVGKLTAEEIDKAVASAMGVIMHMSGTIDDFRNFFNPEKEPRTFCVNQVVSRALNFLSPELKSIGINVTLDEQPDIPAHGHPNEYLQTILNILINAKDALLKLKVADPLISIRIFRENDHSIVTIRDNAGGISEDVLPKIFDPYFTTKEQGKGTGIGLYMSKAIIEKNMGGHLSACNVDGGAEFRIEV
jgi:PAS domain S-box-containing protein